MTPRTIVALAFVVMAVVALNRRVARDGSDYVTVLLGGRISVRAEVADDPLERARGLSGREGLAEGEGMLFMFGAPEELTFWMAGMRFPIDIVWINGGRIIGIEENAPPPGNGPAATFSSPGPAEQVLEVPAGFMKERGIVVGSVVLTAKAQ